MIIQHSQEVLSPLMMHKTLHPGAEYGIHENGTEYHIHTPTPQADQGLRQAMQATII